MTSPEQERRELSANLDSPATELPIQVLFLKIVFKMDENIIRKTSPEYGIPIAEYWNDLDISYKRVGEMIGLTPQITKQQIEKGMKDIWDRSPKEIQRRFRLNEITKAKSRTGRFRSPQAIEKMKASAQIRRERERGM
jgi:hypothetical protein